MTTMMTTSTFRDIDAVAFDIAVAGDGPRRVAAGLDLASAVIPDGEEGDRLRADIDRLTREAEARGYFDRHEGFGWDLASLVSLAPWRAFVVRHALDPYYLRRAATRAAEHMGASRVREVLRPHAELLGVEL